MYKLQLGKSSIGEGDGYFATQDLEPGTVLLISKPFAALYVSPREKSAFSFNTSTLKYIVGVMANKIRLDPSLGRDLYKMWAGPDLKSLIDNEDSKITKVNVARIKKIYECFICRCRLCELDRSESPIVIAKRDKLLKSLAFNPTTNQYHFDPRNLIRDLETITQVEKDRAATPDLNFPMTYSGIHAIASLVLLDKCMYSDCLHILETIYAVYRNVPPNAMHPDLAAGILAPHSLVAALRLHAGTLEHVRAGDHPTLPENLKKFGIEFFTD
ncbi:hypothetical protein Fcan01_00367 [Folsomia candida]|uniref:Uncharacterized protein n=1 Tax=Folsomia candida TaxID=158441 RepID=A0A226F3V0_FOLCA|nr:hypothetical protein Fcan01_00367 [Folsomia candida]